MKTIPFQSRLFEVVENHLAMEKIASTWWCTDTVAVTKQVLTRMIIPRPE